MTVDRRTFLKLAAAASFAVPVLQLGSVIAEDGFRELVARKTKMDILNADGPSSELWGYDGQVPGPILRARKGETIRIRFRNELDEPTSVHWHGIRIVNAMDGVSGLTQDAVAPGESFDYVFVVPDAGTYWYHAHNRSWNEVARGLYGLLVVDEPEPLFAPAADISLVLDDWRVGEDGRFDEKSLGHLMDWSHGGRLGNILAVNGHEPSDIAVARGRWYRLRLLNASNARILAIDLEKLGAKVIAYDGQPLGEARTPGYSPHLLGPAQRVDLVVRFERPGPAPFLVDADGASFPFATFLVGEEEAAPDGLPAFPSTDLPVPDLDGAHHFKLVMQGGAMGPIERLVYKGRELGRMERMQTGQIWAFNGVANLADQPFFSVKRGETVVIETVNDTAFAHAMHTHGHHFRVLERSGSNDREQPWRDTFLIGPSQTTKIAFVADNPGKWLYHCHMLEHAAAGMSTWYEIT